MGTIDPGVIVMTKYGAGTVALMFAVVVFGVLLGGVVFSNAIVMPAFLGDLPASAIVVNGPFALNEAPFWMLIHPIAIISLVASLALNWGSSRRRKLIAITLGAYVMIIAITAIYFVPELLAFGDSARSNIPASEWAVRAPRWRTLSWIRGGVMFVLYLPLLMALVDSGGSERS